MAQGKYCFFGGCGMLLGAGYAAYSTGLVMLSGVTGSAIMNAAGYEGYNVSETMSMGFAGGATLSIPLGILVCCAIACGQVDSSTSSTKASGCTLSANVLFTLFSGLIGHHLIEPEMHLAETALAFFIGSLVSGIPVSLVLVCCVLPLVLGSACLAKAAVGEVQHSNYHTFS